MRIKRITVKKFKNLVDFDCEFSDSNISAFIGNNGAGKSNLLELITMAFSNAMNYYCGKPLTIISVDEMPSVINCTIEYEIKGSTYQLLYNDDILNIISDKKAEGEHFIYENVKILYDGKIVKKSDFPEILPSSILLYYAGETNRQKVNAEDTYDSIYNNKLKKMKSNDLPGLKYMDYYEIEDLPLLLLSISAYKGKKYNKLLDLFRYQAIVSKFSVVIGNPDESKVSRNKTVENYWGSVGFVKHFLDALRKYVLSTNDDGKKYFLFFEDSECLKNISDNEFELFSKFKALKNYGILKHIGIRLKSKDGNEFSQSRLSEGEKQLALIYLLTSFTEQSDCLYLFDELDAYLHLNWQRAISKMINETETKGHIIFTTHSPGTISQIKSENLYIVKDGNIVYPESETYNRALDEIMFEQMNVSMRSDEIELMYDQFKQSIARGNKEQAEHYMQELKNVLDEKDPLLLRMKMNLRRI